MNLKDLKEVAKIADIKISGDVKIQILPNLNFRDLKNTFIPKKGGKSNGTNSSKIEE